MTETEYDVVYIARSPAAMRQEDFAVMITEKCNERRADGWRMGAAVGDYGAKVTLGVWLYFTREAAPASDQQPAD